MKKPTAAQLRALQEAATRDIPRITVVYQTPHGVSVVYHWECVDGSFVAEKTVFACERAGWLRAEGTLSQRNFRLVLTEAGRAVLPA